MSKLGHIMAIVAATCMSRGMRYPETEKESNYRNLKRIKRNQRKNTQKRKRKKR